MQSYAPQESRSLFGAAAVALTMLTMATLVVGPAMLAQRHAPSASPEVARSAPSTREVPVARERMEVVLQRAAYVDAVPTSTASHRRGHRG